MTNKDIDARIDSILDNRFNSMGANKEAMKDALVYIYRDMAMSIEAHEEAGELSTNECNALIEIHKKIIKKWWFRLFCSKKLKDLVLSQNCMKEQKQLYNRVLNIAILFKSIKNYFIKWYNSSFFTDKELREKQQARIIKSKPNGR